MSRSLAARGVVRLRDAVGDQHAVIGRIVVSTVFVGFGGVVFPILPNVGEVIGIAPFLVGGSSARTGSRGCSPTRPPAPSSTASARGPLRRRDGRPGLASPGYLVATLSPTPET